jgi:hypothetical protein
LLSRRDADVPVAELTLIPAQSRYPGQASTTPETTVEGSSREWSTMMIIPEPGIVVPERALDRSAQDFSAIEI